MIRALVVLCVLTATASAQPKLELRIEGREIHAHVRGAHAAEMVQLVSIAQPAIRATRVRGFRDGGPVGIAFVLEAQSLAWGANTQQDKWSPEVDLYTAYVAAFDRLSLGTVLPPGSEALLVNYATAAWVEAPWQPAASFAGAAIGDKRGYLHQIGVDLVSGIEVALAELDAKKFARKIVFVLGDGNDTNNETGKPRLRELRRERADVLFVAVILESPVSTPGIVVTELAAEYRHANAEGLEAAIKKVLERATMQFDATFDLAKFHHDGAEHLYTLVADGVEVARASLTMPRPAPPPSPSTLWRWSAIGAAASLLALLWILKSRERR